MSLNYNGFKRCFLFIGKEGKKGKDDKESNDGIFSFMSGSISNLLKFLFI